MDDTVDILSVSGSGALFEGPVWDARSGQLYWVDILLRNLYRLDIRSGSISSWSAPERCSAVIPMAKNAHEFLVPGERRIWLFDSGSGQFSSWIDLAGEPENNRCNDAKCDPWGALWLGSMDLDEQALTGAHWRVSADGRADCIRTGLGIANTWCWDATRQRVYWADSKSGNIYVSSFGSTDGLVEVSQGFELFVRSSDAPGVPDGSAIDMDGNTWNARWGSGLVIGFDPEGREIARLPTGWKYPTSCAFYGSGMNKLAVTCASTAFVDSRVPTSAEPRTTSAAIISVRTGTTGAEVALFGVYEERDTYL